MLLKYLSALISLLFSLAMSAQDVSALYEQIIPSVVQIFVDQTIVEPIGNRRVTLGSGLGSGVLIDADEGLVLTAAHVVQTSSNIRVEFPDGAEFLGTTLYSSQQADVALIKLAAVPTGKRAIPLGDSDAMSIGAEVLVIGAPRGLSNSLSVGHISGRRVKNKFSNGVKYVEFFQTDASINQGNSGGPMINMQGEIVGITSFILSQSGGFEGIGFAATSNVCRKLLLEWKEPWTGIEGHMLKDHEAWIFNLPVKAGLLVQKVAPDSPADLLGLKGGFLPSKLGETDVILGGDIILQVNGITFENEDNIERIIEREVHADQVELDILRGGDIIQLKGSLRVE